jgi:predicted transposase YbfD/YdcC
MVQSTRQTSDGTCTETRYYITSHKKLDAQRMGDLVRQHWSIQNSLHSVLDVSMGEDDSWVRVATRLRT